MPKGQRAKPYSLQLSRRQIAAWAERYSADQDEEERAQERQIVEVIAPAVQRRGHFTRDEFVRVCHWKSLRSRKRYEGVGDDLVIETTKLALGAQSEELRVGTLLVLDGVSWPTASVLLHFGHPDPYPILDFRALESLNVPRPSSYTFGFWWRYVEECRRLARKYDVDMRTLDRALWQHSAKWK